MGGVLSDVSRKDLTIASRSLRLSPLSARARRPLPAQMRSNVHGTHRHLHARGVLLTEAAFVIVTSLFALELIVLLGLILKTSALIVLKASALPHVRLNAGRALPRPHGARLTRPRIAAPSRPVVPFADEANRVLAKSSNPVGSPSAPHSIDELARAIGEAQSWRDPTDRP